MKEMKAVFRSIKNPRKWPESITARIDHATYIMVEDSEYRLGIENKRIKTLLKNHTIQIIKNQQVLPLNVDHSP